MSIYVICERCGKIMLKTKTKKVKYGKETWLPVCKDNKEECNSLFYKRIRKEYMIKIPEFSFDLNLKLTHIQCNKCKERTPWEEISKWGYYKMKRKWIKIEGNMKPWKMKWKCTDENKCEQNIKKSN